MKQRIRVIGITRRGGEILFLKRAMGRSLEAPKYELPTSKIVFGEQPEEAMGRSLMDYLKMQASKLELADVVTFTYLEGANQLGNLYIVYRVTLPEDGKITVSGERYTAYKWVKSDEIEALNTEQASSEVLRIMREVAEVRPSEARAVANSAVVYVDGGSRGNPGPAGVGYYILAADGSLLKKGGEFIGFNTSRIAEYYALREGLEQAVELGLKQVRVISDNLMVVNQINGIYKVKNADLVAVNADVRRLLDRFDGWTIEHVPRSQNTQADREVNIAIDAWAQRSVDGVL
jgi:ribonuclease HI